MPELNFRALAEAETPGVRLAVLKQFASSSEPQSATCVSKAIRADLAGVQYHCRTLLASGLIDFHHGKQVKSTFQKFYVLAEGARA